MTPQDQARRMAEEAELPEPVAYGAMDDYGNYEVSRNPICANGDRLLPEKQVREAIATALVKLTEGQDPEHHLWWLDDKRFTQPFPADETHLPWKSKPLYTHPSQQEERKPLTEGTAAAHLRDLVEALDGAFISSWQSTAKWQNQLDAAREYLKE